MLTKVVLTRAENNLNDIQEHHPEVEWISFPLITFEYIKIPKSEIEKIINQSSWLVFTSQNALKSFMEQAAYPSAHKIACVGPKTRDLAEHMGLKVDFVPTIYTSKVLAEELPIEHNESICYVGGNLINEITLKILQQKASKFYQLEVYQTIQQIHPQEEWIRLFNDNPNIISFCSPSAVRSFYDQTQKHMLNLPNTLKYAAIGSTTAVSIKDYIGKSAIVGEKHTFAGMIQKIIEKVNHDQKTQKT